MSWDAALRAGLDRLGEPGARRVVFGPQEGPAGPWVAFRRADEQLLIQSDASEGPRPVADREAPAQAGEALRAHGLTDLDPLVCFVEGVDRDPVRDDDYSLRKVLRAIRRGRRRGGTARITFTTAAGPVVLEATRRRATITPSKAVNAAQREMLADRLGFTEEDGRWTRSHGLSPEELEEVVGLVWARVSAADV